MKIKDLFDSILSNYQSHDFNKEILDVDFFEITEYIQDAKEGSVVFVTLPESTEESTKIIERYRDEEINLSKVLFVSNVRLDKRFVHIVLQEEKLLEKVCEHIYPFPTEVKLLGVTGTNGKTSIVNMTARILEKFNVPMMSMGTVGITLGKQVIQSGSNNSTFPYSEIRKVIHRHKEKMNYVMMELTSHALEQGRLKDLNFEHVFWTNFTQDHLDYHGTEENYFQAKLKITSFGKELFLPDEENDLINRIKATKNNIKINSVKFKNIFSSEVPDGFIKSNLALSIKAAELVLGKEINDKIGNYLDFLPEGRFQVVEEGSKVFIIDYAHTPDALEKLLKEVEINFPKRKRVTVFGCGGDRDRRKRSIMGKVVQEHSDQMIVTSDNPRFEDPQQIISDIQSGMTVNSKTFFEVDRKEAIRMGVNLADSKNIIIIAGKGHEDYQEIRGVKHPFKDIDILKEVL